MLVSDVLLFKTRTSMYLTRWHWKLLPFYVYTCVSTGIQHVINTSICNSLLTTHFKKTLELQQVQRDLW